MSLREYRFSDFYLGDSVGYFSGVPGSLDPVPLGVEHFDEATELLKRCHEVQPTALNKDEFAVSYNDVVYRVSVLRSLAEDIFVLRKFPPVVPSLKEVGVSKYVIDRVMTPGLTGLVIVAGSFSNGKTTTASSLIKGRLEVFGGVAITIEDPPEMPLQGKHGCGVCFQTQVNKGEFADQLRSVARWAPSIIFLGEIRDNETAMEALKVSINGRLVVCTLHADSVISAVERLFALSTGSSQASDDVANLLANGLSVVIHQQLMKVDPEGMVLKPKIEMLNIRLGDNPGVKTMIKNRKFDQLSSEISLQLNKFLTQTLER